MTTVAALQTAPLAVEIPVSNRRIVQFSDETYAEIDPAYGLVTIRQGQQAGSDSDWGGRVIATVEIDKLQQLAALLSA